ncbi:TPA: hypothetical protein HA278_03820 [Candidatus Woesearchaeota archaeon]|nr:hypothetical protein [Candidatus Woesearchaeota archaeon]
MVQIKTLCNKWMTIGDLLNFFGTPIDWKYKKQQYEALRDIGDGELWSSGRHNHIWIQDIFQTIMNGIVTIGGQGTKNPDLFLNEEGELKRVEVKGFDKKNKIRVSASKFFASNGGMTELANCSNNEEKIALVKAHYHDDYYLLTKSNGNSIKEITNVEKIEFFLIKTEVMIPLLQNSNSVPSSILDLSEVQ